MAKKIEATGPKLGTTTTKMCSCTSSFQDQRYGSRLRVHNVGKSKLTCTVCGTAKLR